MKTKLMCSMIMCMLARPCVVWGMARGAKAVRTQITSEQEAAEQLTNRIALAFDCSTNDIKLHITPSNYTTEIGTINGTTFYLNTSYYNNINALCLLLQFNQINKYTSRFTAVGPFWNIASCLIQRGNSFQNESLQKVTYDYYVLSNEQIENIKTAIQNALDANKIDTIKNNPKEYGFLSDALNGPVIENKKY
jgi:hypothetical protein